ncbi:MAG: hypothetical protein ACO1RT_05285, partial [Planctomycetaceae bacterium]
MSPFTDFRTGSRLLVVAAAILAGPSWAQTAGSRQMQQQQARQAQQAQRLQQQLREVAQDPGEITDDPQLMNLHKEFIAKAEKLALEFERKKQYDKARDVYASLVRLVPSYANAEESLGRILGSQAVQDRQLTTV